MILQLAFVLTAIIVGARLGGIGLGVMGGIGFYIRTATDSPSDRRHADDSCCYYCCCLYAGCRRT